MEYATNYVMGNYGERDLTLSSGKGAYLYDEAGARYLDFTAGIAVCNLGHAHPAVTRTIAEQAGKLIHCSNLYGIPDQYRLAERLTELSGLHQAFFCNSGTEAIEAAIKLARKFHYENGDVDRTQVLSLPGGFHGRTYGALSITGKPKYQAGFGPLVADCETPASLSEVAGRISEKTAAVFVEVVQGEGGVHPLPDEFLRSVADRCQECGALLVVDEIQTGMGRTGAVFAFQGVGLQPDIVTMAKGLANGVPVGAVLARSEVASAFTPGSHGSTFGGNPLAMAVANSVLDAIAQAEFLEHVRETGDYLARHLRTLGTEVTGRGLMWGMTVPNAKQYVADAMANGVLLTAVGDNRVRFVPPLVIEKSHVDELTERLTPLSYASVETV